MTMLLEGGVEQNISFKPKKGKNINEIMVDMSHLCIARE